MTIYVQQSSQAKPSSGPMSIICTGPVIPSVIYHHHMYYLSPQNGSSSNNCCMSLAQPLSPSLVLPNVPNLVNTFMDSVAGSGQVQLGALVAPRVTVPVGNGYSPTWPVEYSAVKVNASFHNQMDGSVTLDRCKQKECSAKSCASSCSASSSSYFASLSSCNSSRLSPFSTSSASSPPTPSSPSTSPPSNSSPESSSPESAKSESESKPSKSGTSSTSSGESSVPTSSSSQLSAGHKQCSSLQQPATLLPSSLTPSLYGSPLLSGNGGTVLPGAYFGTSTGSLPNQATGAYSTSSSVSMRDHYARYGVYYIPAPWNQSYGMERVWMSEFRRIFSAFYNELWSIQPVERKPTGIKLHMFVDSAKVRFCCDKCGHSWTSMKGRIVFWFNLLPPNFNIGIVTIKLFGQKCEVCKMEVYEQPMWYPEEVTKVLMNLFNRVGQIFYGFEKTKFEKQRRMGKPRTPHNKFLCQACLEGICLSRRRACAAAGQQVSACAEEQSQKISDDDATEPEQVLPSDPDKVEPQLGTCNETKSEPVLELKGEEDDEDSEDSGISEIEPCPSSSETLSSKDDLHCTNASLHTVYGC